MTLQNTLPFLQSCNPAIPQSCHFYYPTVMAKPTFYWKPT